jgi:hypothetical protein
MENITSYTSPFSGRTYQVGRNTLWHQAWDNQGKAYKKWYTEYNFYRKGRKVVTTFSLEENCLVATFGELEGFYAAQPTSARD